MRKTITMPKSLLHPLTGQPIVPVGARRDGTPIWPIMGGAEPDDAAAKAAAEKAAAEAAAKEAADKEAADKAAAEELAKIDGLGDKGKQAILREREKADAKAKEAAAEKKRADDLAAKVKEFEDSKKSAEQLAAEQLESTKKSADENATLVLKYQVAAAKDLPLSAAERLRGSTKEALEADADELKKLLGDSKTSGDGRPRPDHSQGGGDGSTGKASVAQVMADRAAARAAKAKN